MTNNPDHQMPLTARWRVVVAQFGFFVSAWVTLIALSLSSFRYGFSLIDACLVAGCAYWPMIILITKGRWPRMTNGDLIFIWLGQVVLGFIMVTTYDWLHP